MELIDRRKLVSDFWQGVEDGSILSYEDTDELMEKAPTVDAVEVVHGRWENNHCNVCGMTPIGEELWKHLGYEPPRFELCMDYCPNCGADMRERKDND